MLKIYGTDLSSPSNKVRFVANSLGLKYEYIKINLRAGEQLKQEFVKINPDQIPKPYFEVKVLSGRPRNRGRPGRAPPA